MAKSKFQVKLAVSTHKVKRAKAGGSKGGVRAKANPKSYRSLKVLGSIDMRLDAEGLSAQRKIRQAKLDVARRAATISVG